MMVLQALKSDSYQSSSMSSESLEMNDELKKLERYVETLKKEHEQEIERLNAEHEQDLEQLRSDMVTLLRVQETYKTSDEDKVWLSLNLYRTSNRKVQFSWLELGHNDLWLDLNHVLELTWLKLNRIESNWIDVS